MARRYTLVADRVERDLLLTREIDAARVFVFRVCTSPVHVCQWLGPHGFTNPLCEVDFRPGGAFRIDMRSPQGAVYPIGGFYQEIIQPEKLVFSCSLLDGLGHSLVDVLTTATFVDQGNKTQVTVRTHVLRATDESAQFLQRLKTGWRQTLSRLDEYVRDSLKECQKAS